jgi:Domain of unknown function (DUF1844)
MVAFLALITGAMMTKEQEEQDFKVTDKRSFREDGEPGAADTTPKAVADTPIIDPSSNKEDAASNREADADARPPIDFPSYILSYYTHGLVLLGEVPNPYTNKKEEDMESARHMIDILSMLEQKTKGNLSPEEDKLLESVLYELRMKFMAKTNRIKI